MSDNVCWHEDRADWGHRETCPARDGDLILWGRCRSGRRWFWAVYSVQTEQYAHGWTGDEDQAVTAARAAVVDLADGKPASASISHGTARRRLKQVNAEKRRQRPASGDTDGAPVEYLYYEWWDEDCRVHLSSYRVLKKTSRRIYYLRSDNTAWDGTVDAGFVDRQAIEAAGSEGVWSAADREHLYLHPPVRETRPRVDVAAVKAELSRLKAEMAAAHPDVGGNHEAFLTAHKRWDDARRQFSRLLATSTEGASIA